MNLQLHHVISDITGLTGTAIIDAILQGERDPLKLAGLRDGRIKATERNDRKSLGWRLQKGASVYASPIFGCFPPLPAVDRIMRRRDSAISGTV